MTPLVPDCCNLAYGCSIVFGQQGVDAALLAMVPTAAGHLFARVAFPQELDVEFPDRPIGDPSASRHCT